MAIFLSCGKFEPAFASVDRVFANASKSRAVALLSAIARTLFAAIRGLSRRLDAGAAASILALAVTMTGLVASGAANAAGAPATIEVGGGSGQSAVINSYFATRLSATVKDVGGTPVSGATVTFTPAANGASGRFVQDVVTAVTDASGLATAAVFTANDTVGNHQVSASVAGVATPAVFSLTNTSAPTSVTLSSSPNASTFGQSVTFAARVTSAPGAPAPSGNLTLTDLTGPTAFGTPTLIAATQTQVVTTDLGTCSLDSLGGVWCWGRNDVGQVGDGTNTERLTPVPVTGLSSGVVGLSAGGSFVCALTSAGRVKCWGANSNGELGNGSTASSSNTPVDIPELSSGVTAIASGNRHTCALMATGTMKCWGYNLYGALGDGTDTLSRTPVDVLASVGVTLSGVTAITAGNLHTCALTTGGAAKCWGYNINGQLGDGAPTRSPTSYPVAVSGLESGVASIIGGGLHTCAVTTAGAAKCWGRNDEGQLGDGTNSSRATPADVIGLSSGVAAAVSGPGALHTCAVTTAGTVKCWGTSGDGRLGNGTNSGSNTPVDVVGLSNASSLAIGGRHSCARTTAGTVTCWGRDFYGQLGDGLTTDRNTPVLARHPGLATASLATTALGGGTRTIEAAFAATANLAASSATVSQTINKASTTTTLGSSSNPSRFGQSITLSSTVSSAVGTPTGSVDFYDGGTLLGTGTLDGNGHASISTTAVGVGIRPVIAQYQGSTDYSTSLASGGFQQVLKAETTTALGSSSNPSLVNDSVTLTATVTAKAPGGGTPAGSVEFFDGATSLGTSLLDGNGIATLSTANLPVAVYSYSAAYVGNGSYLDSSSSALQQTVTKRPNVVTFPALADTTFGAGSVTLTATASSPLAVDYVSTTTPVCTVAGSTVTLVGTGTCTITASQAGNGNYDAASDVTQSFDIGKAAVGVALNAPSTARISQSVALGAVVSATPAGAGAPAGTVEFLDGSDVIASATTVNGIAVARVSTLGLGDHTLSARFVETALFTGATTGGKVLRVGQAGTRVLMSPSYGKTVRPGQPATVTAYVQPTGAARGVPGGAVTFSDDGSAIATDTLTAGVARRTITTQVSGNHVITGAYGGSTDFEASSGTVALTVDARLGAAVAPDGAGAVASEETPAMAALSNSGTAVVWSGVATGGSIRSIHGRVFGPSGAAVGSVFALGEATEGLESRPRVTRLFGAPGAVAVWQSQDANGLWTVRARRFGENGVTIGPSLRIDTGAGSTVEPRPVVAALPFGGYLVVWRGDADGGAILMRRFTVGGTPRAAAVRIDDAATGAKSAPAVTAYADGGFLAVYAAARPSPATGSEIRGVVVPAKGSAGVEVALSPSADSATNPSLPVTVGAARLVLYTRDLGAGLWAVDGRGLAVNGTTLTAPGASFRLDTDGAGDAAPAVATYPNGDFVAAWTKPGASPADDRVKIARYRATGEVVDPPQTVLARETRTPALSVRSNVAYTLTLQATPLLGGDPSISLQRYLLAAPVPPN